MHKIKVDKPFPMFYSAQTFFEVRQDDGERIGKGEGFDEGPAAPIVPSPAPFGVPSDAHRF
jgi:hypothetical protein